MSKLCVAIVIAIAVMVVPKNVMAAPYFSITGSSGMYPGSDFGYGVVLNTDSEILTSAHTVITYDGTIIDNVAIDARNTPCSFWAPADPSLGYGNLVSPYFYQDSKIVVSCGFSNPGYQSADESGEVLLTFYLTPAAAASESGETHNTSFSFSNTLYYYIANSISPGASADFAFTVFPTALAATPTPTPTTYPESYLFDEDDLNFIELSAANTSGTGLNTQSTSVNNAVERDDAIPPPPDDLEQRAPVTPFKLAPITTPEKSENGDVLSLKSLREILLPGKSGADQTVVFINLISTIAFLIILTILVWRLILISRKNKLKFRYMKDMLKGELSVFESKFASTDENDMEYRDQLEKLRKDLESVQ